MGSKHRRRYLEWDYSHDQVIEYRKLGECHKCGQCCHAFISFMVLGSIGKNKRNGGITTDSKGLWHEVDKGHWRHFFKMVETRLDDRICPSLGEDQLCRDYDRRHAICEEWPFGPSNLTSFPDCGFRFELIRQWRISELKGADSIG